MSEHTDDCATCATAKDESWYPEPVEATLPPLAGPEIIWNPLHGVSPEKQASLRRELERPIWGDTDSTNPKDRIGIKKPRLDLVPPALDLHVSMAMANGADKYGPFNWRAKDVRASVYVAAARRHLMQWFDGEDTASDSGVHHLGHAAACLAIILDAQATGNLVDDRPPTGASSRLIEELTVQ